jgi:beta-glucanase (GH16 family)
LFGNNNKNEWYIDRNYTSGRINTAGKASWGPGHRIVAKVFPRDVKL